jgi:hypothetical protein
MTRDRAFVAANHHPVEAAIIRIVLGLKPGAAAIQLDLWNRQGLLPAGVVHLRRAGGDPYDADDSEDDDDDDSPVMQRGS